MPIIYHVGDQPFTISAFLCGGTLLLGRRPDAASVAEMIAAERVTALWAGSPAMVRALDAELTATSGLDVTSLTVLVYGWAALPPATLESLRRHCGAGVAGEAVYRTPAVMAGYYRDEAATRHAFRFGWFHSGDSCAYDDDGLRIMLDRYKDIVKTGARMCRACG
jgi:acyl-CoA synthetase (AMP-forming)/AMP-acid ligase II